MKILRLEKINFDDIVVGEPLTRNIYDNRGKLLLRKNCVIESERQLKILTDRGVYHALN